MQRYQNNVQTRQGNAVTGANVYVRVGSSLAIIYSDNGVTPIANPTTTDDNGEFFFYAANGLYQIEAESTKLPVPKQYPDVILFDPDDSNISSSFIEEFTFTPNGTAGPFVLGLTPDGQEFIEVFLGPTFQPSASYTLAGNQITFSEIVNADNEIITVRVFKIGQIGGAQGSAVSFIQDGSGATLRNIQSKGREWVSVKDFGAVGDGVTSDQTAIQNAVTYCLSSGATLLWPFGTYVSTANVSSFHSVRHTGAGSVLRSGSTWKISPIRTTVRAIYASPSGVDTNDGLSSGQPRTLQGCVNALNVAGPIVGRQQIVGPVGTYNEKITIPKGLAINDNYLEFSFPSTPGVRGDPSTWAGAILDGTNFDGITGNGIEVNSYNNVYFQYLLLRDWYDTALPNVSQVKRGMAINEFAFVYCYGVSAIGNGWSNIACDTHGHAVITGGILDGARYGVDNTGGRMSFTASALTYTTIKNALEYGLYQKHQSSTVLDYTEFLDNGQLPAAADYGCAIFAYKSNASVDTRACTFKRNNICFHARGGFVAGNPSLPDVFGTGVDANDRIWLIRGFGADDTINQYAKGPRELSENNAGASTASAVTVRIFDTDAVIPAQYLTQPDAHVEIQAYCSNGAGGTAQIRPSWVSVSSGIRYEIGNWQIAASTFGYVNIIMTPASGGATSSIHWTANNMTIGGATSGTTTPVTAPFDTDDLRLEIWGEAVASTVVSRRTRCILWG